MQDFQIAEAQKQRQQKSIWSGLGNSSPLGETLTQVIELCGADAATLYGSEGVISEQSNQNPTPGKSFPNEEEAEGTIIIEPAPGYQLKLYRNQADTAWTLSPATQAIVAAALREQIRAAGQAQLPLVNIDLLPMATALLSGDGNMLQANPAFAKMLGYQAHLLKGANLLNFLPAGRKIPQNMRTSIKVESQLVNGVTEMIRAGGTEFPVFQRVFKLPAHEGDAPRFVLQLINMTDIHNETILLKKTIKEQESVIYDTDHRLKSNLQLVCSLLDLEARTYEDPWVRSLFEKSRLRITAISLLNKHLFHLENNKALVRFDDYLKALIRMVQSVKSAQHSRADLEISTGNIVLMPQKVLYCGLIIHELLANAYDHAFPGNFGGRIKINSHLEKKKHVCRFEIFDNGVGLAPNVAPETATSTGFKLIRILLRQLQAKMEYRYENGSLFIVEFNLSKTEAKQSKISN